MTNHTEIKKQLIEQVQKQNIPNKDQIITQIKTMSDSQFEQFLKQNNISPENNCIFCSIVDNQMPSVKIGENEDALAVLEINPISKGHSLIIPKEHIESADKIPPKATDLSKEISDKIKKIFQPKEVLIDINSVMNHIAINIIPVYDKETLNSPRKKTTNEELEKIKIELETKTQEKKEKPKEETPKKEVKKEINDKNTWLPRRKP